MTEDIEEECIPLPNIFKERHILLAALCGCYSLIFLLGICGNCLVLYFLLGRKIGFHFRVIFIVSLTVANLLLILVNLPVTWIQTLLDDWVFGEFVCKITPALVVTAALGTSFTLVLIALERHYTIKNVYVQWLTARSARIAVVAAWCAAFCFSIPSVIFAGVHSDDGYCGRYCAEDWGEVGNGTNVRRLVYGSCVFAAQFAVPILVLTLSCRSVSANIARDVSRKLKSPELSERLRLELVNRRKRVNRMLSVMVVSFLLTWLPLSFLHILLDTPLWENLRLHNSQIQVYEGAIYSTAHIIAMSSVICNPVIYFLCNREFRDAAIRRRRRTNATYQQVQVTQC